MCRTHLISRNAETKRGGNKSESESDSDIRQFDATESHINTHYRSILKICESANHATAAHPGTKTTAE